MGKQTSPVEELVNKIKRGDIKLPEMQRGYVWKSAKVRDLLDSLYRGYPSGTILTWETSTAEDLPTREMAVTQETSILSTYQLLLDGQQRLTSLVAIITGEKVKVKGNKHPIDILFNLDHPDAPQASSEIEEIEEEYNNDESDDDDEIAASDDMTQEDLKNSTFHVSSNKIKGKGNWVSVTEIFKTDDNSDFLEQVGATDIRSEEYKKYNKRLNDLREIKKYEYDVFVLERDKNYEEVTDIFVRVNSSGTKLRGSDLALAQITAKWRNSLRLFEEFQEQYKYQGFQIDLGVFIRGLVVFATGQCRFKNIGALNETKLKEAWEDTKTGFNFAINFLKNNIEIDSQALLSSPNIIIAIAYYAFSKDNTLSQDEIIKLRYWSLLANAKGRYSWSSSENFLDADLAAINGDLGLDRMITSLKAQFGRLIIEGSDLEEKNSGNPYFKTMFLAFKANNAKDWNDGLKLSVNHAGKSHKLEFHHIFPKSLLSKINIDPKKINDIANFAFISGKANRKISNKEPSNYLPEIIETQTDEALTLQEVPVDKELWKLENYDAFLQERRRLVVECLNNFLDHDSINTES